MRVLVSGATGFLGYHIVKLLVKEGYDVVGIGRKNGERIESLGATFKNIDITQELDFEKLEKDFNYIVHSAALSSPWGKYEDFYKVNVIGTRNIINFAKKNNNLKKIVHISTPSIYFNFQDRVGVKESDKLPEKFINYYAKTKYLGEQEYKEIEVPYITLRPRAIYGEYDTSIIPRLIEANKKGFLPLINEGKCKVDMSYAGNIAYGVLLSMKADEKYNGSAYNISNGETLEFREVLKLLFNEMGINANSKKLPLSLALKIAKFLEWKSIKFQKNKEPKLTVYTVAVLSMSQTIDISKIQRELGYKAIYSTTEGLKEYVKWYKKQ